MRVLRVILLFTTTQLFNCLVASVAISLFGNFFFFAAACVAAAFVFSYLIAPYLLVKLKEMERMRRWN